MKTRATSFGYGQSADHLGDLPGSSLRGLASPGVIRGSGMSYGDVSIRSGAWVVRPDADAVGVQFDEATGLLEAPASATLRSLLQLVLPKGWVIPSLPGLGGISLGGAVAADTHGKDFTDAGSIGCWIRRIRLLRSDQPAQWLSPGEPYFEATIGGLGLTGVMDRIAIQCRPAGGGCVYQHVVRCDSLQSWWDQSERFAESLPYQVGWLNAGHREPKPLLMAGKPWVECSGTSDPGPRSIRLRYSPVLAGLLRAATPFLFRSGVQSWDHFLWPLDRWKGWQDMYRNVGLRQLHVVMPNLRSGEQFLNEVREGPTPILAVIKRMQGPRSPGLASFNPSGLSIAMDFPATQREWVNSLSERAHGLGGRHYLVKDGGTPAGILLAEYPQLHALLQFRDPQLGSNFYSRIGLV